MHKEITVISKLTPAMRHYPHGSTYDGHDDGHGMPWLIIPAGDTAATKAIWDLIEYTRNAYKGELRYTWREMPADARYCTHCQRWSRKPCTACEGMGECLPLEQSTLDRIWADYESHLDDITREGAV
jgi:hypothetical protein